MTTEEYETTLEALEGLRTALRAWSAKMRPPDGTPGRFRWAVETTRDANVAATRYTIDALRRAGLLEALWTEEDRAACADWLRSIRSPETGAYRDPALFERRNPEWPEDTPWPTPAMIETVNKYAIDLVIAATDTGEARMPRSEPAPGWPTPKDPPEKILQWIRDRPFETRTWGAGSHSMRMLAYLARWERDGQVAFDLVVRALRLVMERQDPDTGLWGSSRAGRYQRINGTFKLFVLLREILDLPVPHADKIIDQVLEEMDRPDYETGVAGCDELDNWYVLAHALPLAGGHREAEIRDRAAGRIRHIAYAYGKEDGGLSYRTGECQTAWIGIDMAPAKAQGDAMGAHILGAALSVCLDLSGLGDQGAWVSGRGLTDSGSSIWELNGEETRDFRRRILDAMGWA